MMVHGPLEPPGRPRPAASRHAARQRSRAGVLRRRRLQGLSRLAGRGVPGGGRRRLVLGADAQPRASDPGAERRGRAAPGARAVASALCRTRSRPDEAHGAFLAGTVRLRGAGRAYMCISDGWTTTVSRCERRFSIAIPISPACLPPARTRRCRSACAGSRASAGRSATTASLLGSSGAPAER